MNCLKCGIETENPRFCSTSCSVSYNNSNRPKRKRVERFCVLCSSSLGVALSQGRRTRCDDCRFKRSRNDWSKITKGDLRKGGNSNNSGVPYIRTLARKTYIEAELPLECWVCGYALHVEVAHRYDIHRFPDDAPISRINAVKNLIALCKNHHWEFDNGHLSVDSYSKPKGSLYHLDGDIRVL